MSLEVRDSAIHGKGVFTTERIQKHSVIGKVNIVREITEEHPLDPSKGEFYYHCHWPPDGTQLLVGEPHCYLNHSCEPNTFYYTMNKVPYLMAMWHILQNEELTLEYSLCNIGGQVWECKCGAPNCRRTHRCGFRYMDDSRQMQYLPYLDPFIVQVHTDLIQELLNRQVLK
jgi:SET domain-containing protein